MMKRILDLAKEIGVPYEHLLAWCRKAGHDYGEPEDVVNPDHVKKIRSAFARTGPRKAEPEVEDPFDHWVNDGDLDLDDIPKDLDELEALERTLFKTPPVSPKGPVKTDRTPLKSILSHYGIEGKGVLKRLRKLLPEHVARLFNHETLGKEHEALLREALEEKVVLCCSDAKCRKLLAERHGDAALFETSRSAACRLCKGTAARRALEEMAAVCARAGITRILVVGGSPPSHKELKSLNPPGLEFKLVEGTLSRDKQRASADLKWCDVAVIWAGTILSHGVSTPYTKGRKPGSTPVVVASRRSVEALCEAVVQHVLKRGDAPGTD
jgi:hypothetical protein